MLRMTKAPIAMVDLLGFSDMVMKESASQMASKYFDFYVSSYMGGKNCPEVVVFSDTAFMFNNTEASAKDGFVTLVHYLSSLIHNSIFSGKESVDLPVRGAISYGDIFPDPFALKKSYMAVIILGKAVVRAYRWQQSQKWLGASIDPESLELLQKTMKRALGI